MSLYVNKTKMENVYFKGSKIDRVFANGTLVYESTIYVAKPSVSGSYTYNMSTQSAVITGYNAAAMTISGTQSATEAGTYHVYFTLNKGYAWADGSTTKLDFTWSIAKRQINIPSLSSTWFAWVEGNSHNVVVNNLDTNYVNQSGTLSQTDSSSNIDKTYTVSWSLKNATSCVWTDNTNNTKSATWKVAWSNGTSHYSNDLYNCSWNSGLLTAGSNSSATATVNWGDASQPYIKAVGSMSGAVVYILTKNKYVGKTLHATVYTEGQSVGVKSVKYGSTNATADCSSSSSIYSGTTWGEIWGKDDSAGSYYGGLYGIKTEAGGNKNVYIQRVWLT